MRLPGALGCSRSVPAPALSQSKDGLKDLRPDPAWGQTCSFSLVRWFGVSHAWQEMCPPLSSWISLGIFVLPDRRWGEGVKKQGQAPLGKRVPSAVRKLCLQKQPHSQSSVLLEALSGSWNSPLSIGGGRSSERASEVPRAEQQDRINPGLTWNCLLGCTSLCRTTLQVFFDQPRQNFQILSSLGSRHSFMPSQALP